MMENLTVFLMLILVLCSQCDARLLKRCEIARELRKQGFPEHELSDWVCLVESESSGRTDVIGPANWDGSHDHGLFQINDRYWCSTTDEPGKDCNITCAELRTDDITKAVNCVKKIYARHGFDAWYGWKNHCQGAPPYISKC